MTTTNSASFTKLRDGSWGVRLSGSAPQRGQVLAVARKDGTVTMVTVERVIWSGNGAHLCAIAQERLQRAAAPRPSRGPRSGRCRECGGALVSVPHHRAMGGLCGQCAFDEYDC